MGDEIEEVSPAGLEHHGESGVNDDDIDELEHVNIPDMPENKIDETVPSDFDAATTDDTFRSATLRLLDGQITVQEWLDAAAEVVNERVDIPWVPEPIEGQIFEYGLKLAGRLLHGFLRGGSENAPVDA